MDTVLTVAEGNSTTNGCHTGDISREKTTNESATAMATDDDVVQSASAVSEESDKIARSSDKNSVGHRAGFDAFMTGCIFAWSCVTYGQSSTVPDNATRTTPACNVENSEFVNRVYLGGKDFPLQVAHSCFAKPSKCHLEKWQLINSASDSQ